MQGLGGTFDVEETGVESAEPFHIPMLGRLRVETNCADQQRFSINRQDLPFKRVTHPRRHIDVEVMSGRRVTTPSRVDLA